MKLKSLSLKKFKKSKKITGMIFHHRAKADTLGQP
jgi:hypothetical protein